VGANVDAELDVHTIEDMAAVLEPQILGVWPAGPLVIGGFSMGVLVAFELARRLRERGREVPFLVSFDGCAPRFYRQRIPLVRRGLAHARALRRAPAAYVRARAENISRRLSSYIGQDWRFMKAPDLGDAARRARLMRMMVLWERASEGYDPAVMLPLPMLVIRTTESYLPLGSQEDPALGWSTYVSGHVSIVVVPGSHETFLKPVENRRIVADAITRHVSEAVP
jgi:thioesterase domain-containing protein